MSETMSNSNPSDQWMQFYNPNFSPQTSQLSPPPQTQQQQQQQQTPVTGVSIPTAAAEGGRVARPARRRTRASRRTPTTLLNTDTSNFRAMVQQFTGGPAGPHGAGSAHQSFSFGAAMPRPVPAAYYQQIQQQQQQQQINFPYTFGGGAVARPEEGLFQRLSSGRAADEGFVMGVGHPAAARPRGWSSSEQ